MTYSALGLFTEGFLLHQRELWSTGPREWDMVIDDPILRMHKQLLILSVSFRDCRDTHLNDHLTSFKVQTNFLKLFQKLSDVICRKSNWTMKFQKWWLVGIFLGL